MEDEEAGVAGDGREGQRPHPQAGAVGEVGDPGAGVGGEHPHGRVAGVAVLGVPDGEEVAVVAQRGGLGVPVPGVQEDGRGRRGERAEEDLVDRRPVIRVAASDDAGAVAREVQPGTVRRGQRDRGLGRPARRRAEALTPPHAVLVAVGVVEPPQPVARRVDGRLGRAGGPVGGREEQARARLPGVHLGPPVDRRDDAGAVRRVACPLRHLDLAGPEPLLPGRRRPAAVRPVAERAAVRRT
ncbi:hypothetical protein FHE66_09580 [Georgenia sp. 311]|nr:hypothetical protein FHE66_09580 [Georgenia sp. 311]